MRELQPLLARRFGVLASPLRRRRFLGVLALGRREAWPLRATGLVLARRLASRERSTHRIERLFQAAAPPRAGAAAVRSLPVPRLELHRAERQVEVHTVRERVERPPWPLERSTVRLVERHDRALSVERHVVRHDRERIRDRETLRTRGRGQDGAAGRDGAIGVAQQLPLVLRLPFVPAPAARAAESPATPEGPLPAAAPRSEATSTAVDAEHALTEPVLALLTDQVLRRIERRAMAQRERLGIA